MCACVFTAVEYSRRNAILQNKEDCFHLMLETGATQRMGSEFLQKILRLQNLVLF